MGYEDAGGHAGDAIFHQDLLVGPRFFDLEGGKDVHARVDG